MIAVTMLPVLGIEFTVFHNWPLRATSLHCIYLHIYKLYLYKLYIYLHIYFICILTYTENVVYAYPGKYISL